MEELQEKKKQLDAIRDVVKGEDGKPADGTYILQYDGSTPIPEVVVSMGNPATARNVSMTVPGFTTTPERSLDEMVADAEASRDYAEAYLGVESHDTAAVVFMGYQAPQGSDVMTNGKALEGAEAISRELQGIQASNGHSDLNVSAFGHSYGSDALGISLQEMNSNDISVADNFAVYGSPGIMNLENPHHGSGVGGLAGFVAPLPFINPLQGQEFYEGLGGVTDAIQGKGPDVSQFGVDPNNSYYMAGPIDYVAQDLSPISGKLGPTPEEWGMNELATDGRVVDTVGTNGEASLILKGAPGLPGQGGDLPEDLISPHTFYSEEGYTSAFNLAAIFVGKEEYLQR